MKILIFIPTIANGGISKIMLDVINIMYKKYSIDILTLEIKDRNYIKNNNIKIYEIGNKKSLFKLISRYKKEREIIKKGNYDIVHINSTNANRILECIASKKSNVKKIILHSHSSGSGVLNNKLRFFLHKISKELFKYYVTDYVSCSVVAAKWLFPKNIYLNKKYKIVYNGIDINKFKFNFEVRNKIRSELNISDKYVIGMIGRLTKSKNHKFILDIFNDILKKRNNSILLIIGEGYELNNLKNIIKDLSLNDKVIFLGVKKDIEKYMNAIDVLAFPSLYEGFGLVAVEAEANGLKVVSSTNVPNNIKVNDNVFFYSLDEKEKWINEIIKNDDIDRNLLNKNLKNSEFSIENMIKKLEKIYNEEENL